MIVLRHDQNDPLSRDVVFDPYCLNSGVLVFGEMAAS